MTTALVTGASTGIGRELSRLFALEGTNLVLVARRVERLNTLAAEISSKHGVRVNVLAKDLSLPTSADEIHAELGRQAIEVDILVNNAGAQVYGPFHEVDADRLLQLIQLNLVSLTRLTRLFLHGMIERGHGHILNLGSTGSFAPGPLNAVYCASKAYVLSFTEAIAEELAGTGITVTALCPGATVTEFAKRAGIEDVRLFRMSGMDAVKVARAGHQALLRGRRVVVPGLANKLTVLSAAFLPRRLVTKVSRVLMSRA
ncbi:MAG: SDR family oxidoreductase [Deltaproteobacteria bacterium]